MTEADEILTALGYSRHDIQARLGRPSKRRFRWFRRQDKYQSPHEVARAAQRERQAQLMRGDGEAATPPNRSTNGPGDKPGN